MLAAWKGDTLKLHREDQPSAAGGSEAAAGLHEMVEQIAARLKAEYDLNG